MVGAIDRIAVRRSGARKAVVAADVLGGAVHDLNHRPRRAGRQPAPVVDGGAVGGAELLPVGGWLAAGCGAATESSTGGEDEHHVAAVGGHGGLLTVVVARLAGGLGQYIFSRACRSARSSIVVGMIDPQAIHRPPRNDEGVLTMRFISM